MPDEATKTLMIPERLTDALAEIDYPSSVGKNATSRVCYAIERFLDSVRESQPAADKEQP